MISALSPPDPDKVKNQPVRSSRISNSNQIGVVASEKKKRKETYSLVGLILLKFLFPAILVFNFYCLLSIFID